jgi:hypothetical protein
MPRACVAQRVGEETPHERGAVKGRQGMPETAKNSLMSILEFKHHTECCVSSSA